MKHTLTQHFVLLLDFFKEDGVAAVSIQFQAGYCGFYLWKGRQSADISLATPFCRRSKALRWLARPLKMNIFDEKNPFKGR